MANILFIIDMQNDFITGSLGSKQAQALVSRVCGLIRHQKWDKIYCTQDMHEAHITDTIECQRIVKHCVEGTGCLINTQITKALSKLPEDVVNIIIKDTFMLQDAYNDLFFNKEDTITICGLCTDICVVSNALYLRSFYPKTKIIVDASCCVGTSLDKHKAALEVMKSCLIDVVNELQEHEQDEKIVCNEKELEERFIEKLINNKPEHKPLSQGICAKFYNKQIIPTGYSRTNAVGLALSKIVCFIRYTNALTGNHLDYMFLIDEDVTDIKQITNDKLMNKFFSQMEKQDAFKDLMLEYIEE